jgi:hypothetical protein
MKETDMMWQINKIGVSYEKECSKLKDNCVSYFNSKLTNLTSNIISTGML